MYINQNSIFGHCMAWKGRREGGRQPTKNAYFGIVVIVQNPVDSIAICSSPFLHFFSRPLLLLVISVE